MNRRARRLLAELRFARPRPSGGFDLHVEHGRVRLPRGLYVSIPSRAARIDILTRAASLAEVVLVDVHVDDAGSHAGRLVFDVPRRALRRLGLRVPEPGDRFPDGGFVHCFFDEEPLRLEVSAAGLLVVERHGDSWTLTRGSEPNENAEPWRRELVRVLRVVREVERRRLSDGPEAIVRDFRARGARQQKRGPIGRARLRRAIGWIDAAFHRGPNCFRRTLLELVLDAGAARERLVFGLDVGRTGHVTFKGREDRTFDVVYELGPE
jgi:hypothetical protein